MAPNYNAATRAQVVTLKAWGGTNQQISSKTGVPGRTIRDIYARALKRGFDPNVDLPIVQDHHVAEAPRSGRARKQEENKEEVIAKVRRDRYGREKSCVEIAAEINISAMTVDDTSYI